MNTLSQSNFKQTKLQPKIISSDVGKLFHIQHTTTVLKCSAEESSNQFSILQTIIQSNEGPSPHRHNNEDIFYYNLKGEYQFICNDNKYNCHPGGIFYIPKGVTHSYLNIGSSTGSLLCFYTPGGYEKFLSEISLLPADKQDTKNILEISNRYNIDFLDNKKSNQDIIFLQKQDGELDLSQGDERVHKLQSKDTNHQFTVSEALIAPRFSFHLESQAELLIFVLTGKFHIEIDEKLEEITPGSLCVIPKESSYTIKNIGWSPGSILYITC